MILLFGDPDDLSAAYVGWLAACRDLDVVVLREDRLGLDWWFSMDSGSQPEIFTAAGGCLSLDALSGAFVRLNPDPSVPEELGINEDQKFLYIQERRAGLSFFLDQLPCQVINRPGFGRANASKPRQMAALAELGFQVPRWLATNELDEAEAFVSSCPTGAIVKSCSGLRSHVRTVSADVLDSLLSGTAPVVLQERIVGHDVRVHVIGEATMSSAVQSGAVDYRFDDEEVVYVPVDPPADLAARCVHAASEEGLVLAGLDFRCPPEGGWWCLEMNPVPTFLPYEAGCGHQIGDAVVDLLAPGTRAPHGRSPLAHQVAATAAGGPPSGRT